MVRKRDVLTVFIQAVVTLLCLARKRDLQTHHESIAREWGIHKRISFLLERFSGEEQNTPVMQSVVETCAACKSFTRLEQPVGGVASQHRFDQHIGFAGGLSIESKSEGIVEAGGAQTLGECCRR